MVKYILILICLLGAFSFSFVTQEKALSNYGVDSFLVEWDRPDNVVYYKGYASTNRLQITQSPFSCQKLRVAPANNNKKHNLLVRYVLRESPYDLYIKVFAFDIDGNYWEMKLLNMES